MNGYHLMLNITSNPRNIAKIQPFVEDVGSRFDLESDTFGNILVTLTEAVNNAIRHGNLNDARKKVLVKMIEGKDSLTFSVSDEGDGFDYNHLPNPTNFENLFTVGGRGVFLMRELSDNCEFSDNGSTVEMKFKI